MIISLSKTRVVNAAEKIKSLQKFDLILKSQSVYLEVFFMFKSAELFTMKSRADFQTQILFSHLCQNNSWYVMISPEEQMIWWKTHHEIYVCRYQLAFHSNIKYYAV